MALGRGLWEAPARFLPTSFSALKSLKVLGLKETTKTVVVDLTPRTMRVESPIVVGESEPNATCFFEKLAAKIHFSPK